MRFSLASLSLAAVLLFSLPSCTSTLGNAKIIEKNNYNNLQAGTSHKVDVLKTFGQPADVVTHNNQQFWVYRYRHAKSDWLGYLPIYGINLVLGGKNGPVHTHSFSFNNNTLVNHNSTVNDLYTNNFAELGRLVSNPMVSLDSQERVKNELGNLRLLVNEYKGHSSSSEYQQKIRELSKAVEFDDDASGEYKRLERAFGKQSQ